MFILTVCGKAVGSTCALSAVSAGERQGMTSFSFLSASGKEDTHGFLLAGGKERQPLFVPRSRMSMGLIQSISYVQRVKSPNTQAAHQETRPEGFRKAAIDGL